MVCDFPKILTKADLEEGQKIKAQLVKLEHAARPVPKAEVEERIAKAKQKYLADVAAPGAAERFENEIMELRAWVKHTGSIRMETANRERKRLLTCLFLPFAVSVLERALVAAEENLARVTAAEAKRVREACDEALTANQITLAAARPRDRIARNLNQLKEYGADTFPSAQFFKLLPQMALNGAEKSR